MGIAGAEGLDLGVGKRGFVNVLRRAHGAFAGHNLADKLLLALHQLIEVAVKGVLGDVSVNIHLVVLVTLPDNAALPLLKVGRTDFADNSPCDIVKPLEVLAC